MVSTKEFAIALGGVATGILGYAVSKIMGFGNFKNRYRYGCGSWLGWSSRWKSSILTRRNRHENVLTLRQFCAWN